ncbi:MAG: hypothetical protein CMJ49_04775 [Planctomycetaceae bacterium]|nr:hypothetical protein [Planctomycetaceae bacterium]
MQSIAILAYHSIDDSGSVLSVSPSIFAAQMGMLASGGVKCVSLIDAVEHREMHGDWPDNSAVITFDDGFASVHEHALPALKQHGFGATMFVVSDHVGGLNDWERPWPGLGYQPLMDWDQLGELCDAGVEIGAHTVSHADVSRIAPARLETEIEACREPIRTELNVDPMTFAYPFGRVSVAAACVVGGFYRAAVTTALRRARMDFAHDLPRVDMYYFRDEPDLCPVVSGERDRYLTWRRMGRMVRSALTRS